MAHIVAVGLSGTIEARDWRWKLEQDDSYTQDDYRRDLQGLFRKLTKMGAEVDDDE